MSAAQKLIFFYLSLFLTFFVGLLDPSKTFALEKKPYSALSPDQFNDCIDTSVLDGTLCSSAYWLHNTENSMFSYSKLILNLPASSNPEVSALFEKQSAVSVTSKLIAATYAYPVASTAYYLADVGSRLGIPSAYAQGIGFGGLRPILGLWKVARNVAYVFIIIVLMIIGLMVMFRMNIDPHTVISVQAALPRIVVALILITFSYAIAGFLIDLMYLVILLMIGVIQPAFPDLPGASAPGISELQSNYLTGGWGYLFSQTFAVLPTSFLNDLKFSLGGAGLFLTPFLIPALAPLLSTFALPALLLGAGAGSTVGGFLGTGSNSLGTSVIMYMLISIGLLFMFVRILLMLINTYIQILVAVILGPLQLMFDALPAGGGSFSNWLKNLIANIAVFPTVIALLLIGRVISNTLNPPPNSVSPTPLWVPPLIPGWTEGAAQFVIGFGIIGLIPTMVGALKEALKAKPALPIGLGAPMAPFVGGATTALGVGQQFYYGQQMVSMFTNFAKQHAPGRH